MIATILVLSYLSALAALADQLRRPASAWAAADRNRSWWIGLTVTFGLIACGLLVGVAYLVGVVPRFSARIAVDGMFRKQR